MNEIVHDCDSEISTLIQPLGSLILERCEIHGAELSRAMFLFNKLGRNEFKKHYIQANLSKEETNILVMNFILELICKDILAKSKIILGNSDYLKDQFMNQTSNLSSKFHRILFDSEKLITESFYIPENDEGEMEFDFEFEESVDEENDSVQYSKIETKFSIEQGHIKDDPNIFYTIMIAIKWIDEGMNKFVESFGNWLNLSLEDLELTEFYFCKERVY